MFETLKGLFAVGAAFYIVGAITHMSLELMQLKIIKREAFIAATVGCASVGGATVGVLGFIAGAVLAALLLVLVLRVVSIIQSQSAALKALEKKLEDIKKD